MKLSAVLATILGAAGIAGLLIHFGFDTIFRAVAGAGWGIAVVTAFHGVQMLFSALAWRALSAGPERPSLAFFFRMRWIREAVNALLPVAQIGGGVIAARLIALRQARVSHAGAVVTADLTVETLTQVLFALAGLGLLLMQPQDPALVRWIGGGILLGTVAAAGLILAQRFGLMKLVERALIGLGRKFGWTLLGSAAGLHAELLAVYRNRRALAASSLHHGISWVLGAAEVYLALHYLGHPTDLRVAFIIESLGQAVKSAGFAVPGGLGVQEGGYIAICSLFGIPPETALALSLLKRIREVALGLPALLAWQWAERQHAAKGAAPATDREPKGGGPSA